MSPNGNNSEDDSIWIGSRPPHPKEDNTFRIYYSNINGLGSTTYSSAIREIAANQQTRQVDYLGVTEHCININQPKTKSTILQALKSDHLGCFSLQMDSGKMMTTSPYLPGGTAAIILGDPVGRIEPTAKDGDPMGRWSYITLRRSSQPPLIIYTVYQVCAQPTNEVGITAWHQQRIQLNDQGRHNIHPRKAFIDDLIVDIKRHQQMGYDIILGGDMNDTLYYAKSNLLRLAQATELIDPWTKLHPNRETFHS
jgi:hypothetical protein